MRPPSTLRGAWLIARKDLVVEFRTRTAFLSSVTFAVLGLAVFYFAWSSSAVPAIDLAPGVVWVVFIYSSTLAIQRSFGVEVPEAAVDGLLVAPISRESIYLGKAFANVVFVGAIQLVAIPAAALFYNLPLGRSIGVLLAIAALATIGLVAVGTLFAAMAVNTRLAELLLPMLSLPFFMPIVIAAGLTTQQLLADRPIAESMPWLKILIAYDIVFLTVATVVFPYIFEE